MKDHSRYTLFLMLIVMLGASLLPPGAAMEGAVPSGSGAEQGVDAAVERFGVTTGRLFCESFLFFKNQYVAPPYVVERRGLSVYINAHLVYPGPEWPLYDYTVNEDPGAPPPGSWPFEPTPSGLDRREKYWRRKSRYLFQHHDHATAKQMMFELYRNCEKLKAVRWDPRDPDVALLTDETGRERGIDFGSHAHRRPRRTDEGCLAWAQSQMSYYEGQLRSGVLFAVKSLGASEAGMGLYQALPILTALAENDQTEAGRRFAEKGAALDEGGLRVDERLLPIFIRHLRSVKSRRETEGADCYLRTWIRYSEPSQDAPWFCLQDTETGGVYGPFKFAEGAGIRFGPRAFRVLAVADPAEQVPLGKRLSLIVYERVSYSDTPLREVVGYLERRSKGLDPLGLGASIGVDVEDKTRLESAVSLFAEREALDVILRRICEQTGLRCQIKDAGVVLHDDQDLPDDLPVIRGRR